MNETTKLAGTYNKRGLTSNRNNRRKNGGQKRKGKTKTETTGLDDELLKEEAQQRETWSHWCPGPARRQRTERRRQKRCNKSTCNFITCTCMYGLYLNTSARREFKSIVYKVRGNIISK